MIEQMHKLTVALKEQGQPISPEAFARSEKFCIEKGIISPPTPDVAPSPVPIVIDILRDGKGKPKLYQGESKDGKHLFVCITVKTGEALQFLNQGIAKKELIKDTEHLDRLMSYWAAKTGGTFEPLTPEITRKVKEATTPAPLRGVSPIIIPGAKANPDAKIIGG